jgi:hypothetical protein
MVDIEEVKSMIEKFPGSYRFLYSEKESMSSPYIFVGLNPGGSDDDPSDMYIENGNAFMNENWGSFGCPNPLQQQVRAFFKQIATNLGKEVMSMMSKEWIISNYVFYRSSKWSTMASKHEHVENSKALWRKIFSATPPKIIVCNGHDTYKNMKGILVGWTQESEVKSTSAWDGPHISVLKKDDMRCLIVGFAHLSRFKVITRPANIVSMNNVYKQINEFQ